MSFYTNELVCCPECPPRKTPRGSIGIELRCTVSNYSGCSVDIGECPQCRKRFQVSYKVDEVTEL